MQGRKDPLRMDLEGGMLDEVAEGGIRAGMRGGMIVIAEEGETIGGETSRSLRARRGGVRLDRGRTIDCRELDRVAV